MEFKIRQILLEDVEKFLNMKAQLDNETEFMLFEPGERNMNLEFNKNEIEKILKNGGIILIAENSESKIIGFISAERKDIARIRHDACIIIGILESYRRKGLGRKLFCELEKLAREKGIKRFNLTVSVNNFPGIFCYLKLGFIAEGLLKNVAFQDGKFYDSYYMAKML